MTLSQPIVGGSKPDTPSMVIVAVPAEDDPIHEYLEDDGEAHCTLIYLGTVTEGHTFLAKTLFMALKEIAAYAPPFTAHVSGTGHLGESEATVVLLESLELVGLHAALEQLPVVDDLIKLSDGKTYPSYVPHLTLDQDGDMSADDWEGPDKVKFDSIAVWMGDQRLNFPLTGVSTMSTEGDNIVDMDKPVIEFDDDDDDEINASITKVGDALTNLTVDVVKLGPAVEQMAASVKSMVAAFGKFDPSLHPRGADGRFIKKWGVVKWLNDAGKWDYGKVSGIEKSQYGDSIDVTVTPSNLSGVPNGKPNKTLKPKQIYTAPQAKAQLSIKDPKAKKIGEQKGSNSGGLYEIPAKSEAPKAQAPNNELDDITSKLIGDTNAKLGIGQGQAPEPPPQQFYVKSAKTPDHGKNEMLANQLYEDAGVAVPEVSYNASDNNIYSKIVAGQHDMSAKLNAPGGGDQEWLDKVRRNFAVDAWLGNRDVFGMSYDNILTDPDGTPWRIDNGGALLYRAMGAKKTDFGGKVTELDVFRQGKKSKIFGSGMSKEQELDGAQRVLAITPDQIEDRVSQAGLPKSLADTLKARRAHIAQYYGLPLPESIKPQDTDQVSTTAPLVDTADIAKGKGKSRKWTQPISLGQAGFVINQGDDIELPDGSMAKYGLQDDGTPMTSIGAQNQLLGWQTKFGPTAQVAVRKKLGEIKPRPADGLSVHPAALTGFGFQRGDRLVTPEGEKFDVIAPNYATGGMLVQAVAPEGADAPPPFLLDLYNPNPLHPSYSIERWDPPAPLDLDPEMPAAPSGMAVPAAAKIKADLDVPLPDANTPSASPSVPEADVTPDVTPDAGAPNPVGDAPAAPSGKGMVLGDGNEAQPGDVVVSKFGGEYKFVKKKGPYAVVTDPSSDDPEKLLTKKSNTLAVKGKDAQAAPDGTAPKLTTADGKVPELGMTAKAKDGHEGEITMISPDGKFVFITNAAGVKKRKSVGTVTITGEPKANVPAPLEDKPGDEAKQVLTELDIPADEAKQALAELNIPTAGETDLPEVPSAPDPGPAPGEFLPLSKLNLKVGDQINTGGDSNPWMTVTAVNPDGYTVSWPGKKSFNLSSKVTNGFQVKQAAEPTPDLPGGYVPKDGEFVVKASKKVGLGDVYYASDDGGNFWALLDDFGPTTDIYATNEMIPNGDWKLETVYGNYTVPDNPGAKKMDLSDPEDFSDLKPGDKIGDDLTVVGYPDLQGGADGVVAVATPDGQIKAAYLSAFKQEELDVTPQPGWTLGDLGLPPSVAGPDAVEDVYANAWAEPDSTQTVKGNAALSYLALSQGLDPNSQAWLSYDPDTDSFWNTYDGPIASKWNADTKAWEPQPNVPSATVKPTVKNTGKGTGSIWVGEDSYGKQTSLELSSDGFWYDADTGAKYSDNQIPIYFPDFDFGDVVELDDLASPEVPEVDVSTSNAPDTNFGGYKPNPGDTVIGLTGPASTTYWVKQESGGDIWYGVVNGQMSKSAPLKDKDIANLTDPAVVAQALTKETVWPPAPATPEPDVNQPQVDVGIGLPPGFDPAPGQKVIQLTNPNGGKITYAENSWGKYDLLDSGTGAVMPTSYSPEQIKDSFGSDYWTVSDPITPVPAPELAGPSELEMPYQPAAKADLPPAVSAFLDANPGTSVVKTDNDGTEHYYLIKSDDSVWVKLTGTNDTGTAADYQTTPAATKDKILPQFEKLKSGNFPNITIADVTPAADGQDQTPAPAAPSTPEPLPTFGGYQVNDGDQVVKVPDALGGDATTWVKPNGDAQWHMIGINGDPDADGFEDEAITWAIDTQGASVEFGDFKPSSVTPPAAAMPPAAAPTKIDPSNLATKTGAKPPMSDHAKLKALGEIPVGSKLYGGSAWDGANDYYLVSNSGAVHKIYPDGTTGNAYIKAEALTNNPAMHEYTPGAPTAASAPAANGLPTITGFATIGAPSPQSLKSVDAGQTVTVPADGKEYWALTKHNAGGSFMYVKLKPGTFTPSDDGEFNVPTSKAHFLGTDMSVKPGGFDLDEMLDNGGSYTYYVDPKLVSATTPSPSITPTPAPSTVSTPVSTVSTPSVDTSTPIPAPKVSTFPGEFKPTPDAIASWGGALTKDGHIPSVGMYVKKGSMTGQVVGHSKDKTKVSVLTSDNKKSLRLIEGLSVDTTKNYQEYAPKPTPIDVPKGMPIGGIETPAEALSKTIKDGKWRPILVNTQGVKNGSITVTSTTTPSGKKVNRVQLSLTNDQREKLLAKLAAGDAASAPKGDWASATKMSDDVVAGDKIPMRKSSQPNPDGTDRWKVDPDVVPPTHEVVGVTTGAGGVKVVTMKDLTTGDTITSRFHSGKSVAVYTWDPNKPQKLPPGSNFVGSIASAQGWKATASSDSVLSKIEGGTVDGKLSVEPGKAVPSSAAAIGWMNGAGGVRKINTDGSVIEILGLKASGIDSANGTVVMTLPEGLDDNALNGMLADIGVDPTPMTQDSSKHAARGMLKSLLSLNFTDPDSSAGWSDEKLFKQAGDLMGIPDLGWQDVLVGTGPSDGKVNYYWSQRAQTAIGSKTQFSAIVRGGTNASPAAIASQLQFGNANGILKRTAGMQGGGGISASADAKNNAAHGSYSSALGQNHSSLPGHNPLFSKGTGFMVYMNPMAVMGRIQDWRTGPEKGDAYGAGPNYGKGAAGGGNSLKGALSQKQSQDFWLGSGFGPETIGYVAVNSESDRKAAIAEMHKQGLFMVGNRSVEDIVITKNQAAKIHPKDLPIPEIPANAKPITDLPVSYGAVASGKEHAA